MKIVLTVNFTISKLNTVVVNILVFILADEKYLMNN